MSGRLGCKRVWSQKIGQPAKRQKYGARTCRSWAKSLRRYLEEDRPARRRVLFKRLLRNFYRQFLDQRLTAALELHVPEVADDVNEAIELLVGSFEASIGTGGLLWCWLDDLRSPETKSTAADDSSVRARVWYELRNTDMLAKLADPGLLFTSEAGESEKPYCDRVSFRQTRALLAWFADILQGCAELLGKDPPYCLGDDLDPENFLAVWEDYEEEQG